MNNIKLSIIVPVKDEKDFIRRCLDSIKSQMHDGVEVIVIDDGSTDGTSKILEEYFELDRWHFYRSFSSKGVSFARNAGMSNARGEYITFIDADDKYGGNAILTMLKAMNYQHDIVQFNQWRYYEQTGTTTLRYTNRKGAYNIDNKPQMWCMVWNKIYKRAFLSNHSISFKVGLQYGEDELFNLKCMLAGADIYHEREATVEKHFENKNSICHKLNLELVRKQEDILLSLYWGLIFRKEDEWKIKAVEDIIREHRRSDTYLNIGLRKEAK